MRYFDLLVTVSVLGMCLVCGARANLHTRQRKLFKRCPQGTIAKLRDFDRVQHNDNRMSRLQYIVRQLVRVVNCYISLYCVQFAESEPLSTNPNMLYRYMLKQQVE